MKSEKIELNNLENVNGGAATSPVYNDEQIVLQGKKAGNTQVPDPIVLPVKDVPGMTKLKPTLTGAKKVIKK